MFIKRFSKLFILIFVISVTAFILATPMFAKANEVSEVKQSVPWWQVDITAGDSGQKQNFMRNYQKWVICEVIPTAINHCEEPGKGGINNIASAKAFLEDQSKTVTPIGPFYLDSDVHKVLEAMCTAIQIPANGDPDIISKQQFINGKLETWIGYYEGAIAPSGYFDTYWLLSNSSNSSADDNKLYGNDDHHELYCQGHFIEAAVAHYKATQRVNGTPDLRLFNGAIKVADHVSTIFSESNPQHLRQVPGHEEIELALVKLAKLCMEIGGDYINKADKYIVTADNFIGLRGHDWDKRTADDLYKIFCREYYQDHKPVEEQTEAIGHCVRAEYLYTAMCELETLDPKYADKYDKVLNPLWDDCTYHKQYITGAVGDKMRWDKLPESFSATDELSNLQSYCETCAGVGNMLWNRSMSTLYDGSQYADIVEKDFYNAVLGCANFDGTAFYYENHLGDWGKFERNAWYSTACCPPNYARTLLQIGGFIYNTGSNDVYVNQYMSNNANFNVGQNRVSVQMKSGFPYDTKGEIQLSSSEVSNFKLHLRNPEWSDNYVIKVNGKLVQPQEEDGYLVLNNIAWSSTPTTISFEFGMPLRYSRANDNITRDTGLVALQRGPIVYCMEQCDNKYDGGKNIDMFRAYLDYEGDSPYSFTWVDNLGGGSNPYGIRSLYTLKHKGKYVTPDANWSGDLNFVPYYARCNRAEGGMTVFVKDGETLKGYLQETGKTSSNFDGSWWKWDEVTFINDGTIDYDIRWTNYDGGKIRTGDWVRLTYNQPVSFDSFRVWWYDDEFEGGGVRVPSNDPTIKAGNTDVAIREVKEPTKVGHYLYENIFTTANGQPITTNEITMYIHNTNSAAGIAEWELIDSNEFYSLDSISVEKDPDQVVYEFNEPFKPEGMLVKAKYINDITENTKIEEVTDFDYSPKVFTESGQQKVTVTYTYEGVTKTNTIDVTVKDPKLQNISVQKQPNTRSYHDGDSFNPDGMIIKAECTDYNEDSVILEVTKDTEGLSWDPKVIHGENTHVSVEISYTLGDITKTTNLTVAVNSRLLQSIYIYQNPDKLEYDLNDSFDTTGMVVKGKYRLSGGDEEEDEVFGYKCSVDEFETASTQVVTISYRESNMPVGSADKTATVEVQVFNPDLKSIDITKDPQTFYDINDVFKPDGMEVTANYEKHLSKESVSEEATNCDWSPKDPLTSDSTTITITYKSHYDETQTASTGITVYTLKPELTGIEVTTAPENPEYDLHDNFNSEGYVVTGHFQKQVSKQTYDQEVTGWTWDPTQLDTAGDEVPVTISYTLDAKTESAITYVKVWNPTLNSISVINQPVKIEYDLYDTFNPEGMVVQAKYEKHLQTGKYYEEPVDNYAYSPDELTTPGDQIITVSYEFEGVTKTAETENITVYNPVLDSIEVTNQPTKQKYDLMDQFDSDGMEVIGHFHKYLDTQVEFTNDVYDFTYSPQQLTEAGEEREVVVSYTFDDTTRTDSVYVDVYNPELTGIEVTNLPTKLVYELGENFNPTGMVVDGTFKKVISKDEYSEPVEDYTFVPISFEEVGEQIPVTVYYEFEDVVKDTQFDVEVWGTLAQIEVTSQPAKTQYYINEDFDPKGMVIQAEYIGVDGKQVNQEVSDYSWNPTKLTEAGEQIVTISYTAVIHETTQNLINDTEITKTNTVKVNVTDNTIEYIGALTSDNLPFALVLLAIAFAIVLVGVCYIIYIRKKIK